MDSDFPSIYITALVAAYSLFGYVILQNVRCNYPQSATSFQDEMKMFK